MRSELSLAAYFEKVYKLTPKALTLPDMNESKVMSQNPEEKANTAAIITMI